MADVGIKELLEAGVHFGHQTRRWNPRMRRFIHGERDGIHIIDLLQTEQLLKQARDFVSEAASKGGVILFVGTKKQARDSIQEWAERCGMPYVNRRWLGGLLTNFNTIKKRIQRLHELRDLKESGRLDLLPTKERMSMEAELRKLEYNLGGVADMQRLPDAVLIIDLKTEEIGLREAARLEIPIIGLVDTNCDPGPVDYVIPGNDDAIRSCDLIIRTLGEAIEGSAARWRAEEERRRAEEEERKRKEEEERKRREEEEKAKQEAEEKAKQEAEEKARAEAEAKAKAPSHARSRRGAASARARRSPRGRGRRGERLMAAVTAADVKALRDRTGAGMMDCKEALEEAEGDVEEAIRILRKKGAASAAKRSGRGTAEGVVAAYTHLSGTGERKQQRIGVLVEVQCETDFVALNDDFKEFAREVAVHIAAMNPQHVSLEDIPEEEINRERAIFEEKARADGKRDDVVAKVVDGQLKKWAAEVVLLDQKHFNEERYEGKTIEDLRAEVASKTGENVRIARFARFEVGEE